MKVWLIQSVIAPYRIRLFQSIADSPGLDFSLILLSKGFKTRPQWKKTLEGLPFKLRVPFGVSFVTGPERELCINPFFLFRVLWDRPDVVICGGYSLATLAVWVASKVSRTRYVIWTEATILTDGRIRGLRLWLRRLMVKGAGAVVDAGSMAREYVEKVLQPGIAADRLFRSYNCVENDDFKQASRPPRKFFEDRNLPEKNFLFVGALNLRKGIPQLLDAYRRVSEEIHEKVGLVLVGDGELRGEAETFKRTHKLEHLAIEGWVDNQHVAEYYVMSAAFVLLSKIDHNPLVLFEGLAAGIPIVCSHGACNAVDFIKEGVNGYIVDPRDSDQVVARLKDVLGWDDRRREQCRAFSHQIVQMANYDSAAEAFRRACERALAPGLPGSKNIPVATGC